MPILATAGAKLYIGGAISLADDDLEDTDFSGETWVEIKELESLGSLGDTAQEIAFDAIGTRRTASWVTGTCYMATCGIST